MRPPGNLLLAMETVTLLSLHPVTLTTASKSLPRLPEKTQGTIKPGMLLAGERKILSVVLSANWIVRVFSSSQPSLISVGE